LLDLGFSVLSLKKYREWRTDKEQTGEDIYSGCNVEKNVVVNTGAAYLRIPDLSDRYT
jgi:hypothetical protein